MSTTEQQRLEAEIEAQRDQLADTVDALAAKLDVKTQARARAQRLKTQAKAHSQQLYAAGAGLAVVVVVWTVWRSRR